MRKQFAESIAALGLQDGRVHLITGDVGGAMFDTFRALCPRRHIEFGIAEQSMVGFAAGMAIAGLRPIVYTITPFLLERAFEQVKLDIDFQKLPVGLVGYADYPTYGPSHNELDALSMTGMFRNIQAKFPASVDGLIRAMKSIDYERPWFISLKKVPA